MSAFPTPTHHHGPAPIGADDQASRLRDLFRSVNGPAPLPERSIPIVAITSGKGGVGKTNIAVNLATALAPRHRVTLLDGDLGMANADVLCGVTPTMRLQHALPPPDGAVHGRTGAHPSSGASLASIGVRTPMGFTLVPGSLGVARMADLHASEQRHLIRGLSALESRSDVILLDTGAGISPGVLGFLNVADLVLVVATPEPTSIADAYALIKCLASRSGDSPLRERAGRFPARPALVVNQCRGSDEARCVHRRIAGACERFLNLHLPLAGMIERDARLVDSVMARTPVLQYAPACAAAAGINALASVIEAEWLVASRAGRARESARGSAIGRLWRLRGRSTS